MLELKDAAVPIVLHGKLDVNLDVVLSKLTGHAYAEAIQYVITTSASQIGPLPTPEGNPNLSEHGVDSVIGRNRCMSKNLAEFLLECPQVGSLEYQLRRLIRRLAQL